MDGDSSMMDWAPTTPPRPFDPYGDNYVPGAWPADGPPPTTNLFARPADPGFFLPAAKKVCRGVAIVAKPILNVGAAAVVTPAYILIRNYNRGRRERERAAFEANLTETPFRRAIAYTERVPYETIRTTPNPFRLIAEQRAAAAARQAELDASPPPPPRRPGPQRRRPVRRDPILEAMIARQNRALYPIVNSMTASHPPYLDTPTLVKPIPYPEPPVSGEYLVAPFPRLRPAGVYIPPVLPDTSPDTSPDMLPDTTPDKSPDTAPDTSSVQRLTELDNTTDDGGDAGSDVSSDWSESWLPMGYRRGGEKYRRHPDSPRAPLITTLENMDTSRPTCGPSVGTQTTPVAPSLTVGTQKTPSFISATVGTEKTPSLTSPTVGTEKTPSLTSPTVGTEKTPSLTSQTVGTQTIPSPLKPLHNNFAEHNSSLQPQPNNYLAEQDDSLKPLHNNDIAEHNTSPKPQHNKYLAEQDDSSNPVRHHDLFEQLLSTPSRPPRNNMLEEQTLHNGLPADKFQAPTKSVPVNTNTPKVLSQSPRTPESDISSTVPDIWTPSKLPPTPEIPSALKFKRSTPKPSTPVRKSISPVSEFDRLALASRPTTPTLPVEASPKAGSHFGEKSVRKTRAALKKEVAEIENAKYKELTPLSPEWEARVKEAVARGHGRLLASDFERVAPGRTAFGTDNWLNDEVINEYLALIVAHGKKADRSGQVPSHHAFSSFFYNKLLKDGPESVKRWATRGKIGGKALLQTSNVFIPINSGAHWTLAVVSGERKEISYYNSLPGPGKAKLEAIKSWVKAETGSSWKGEEWKLFEGESPMQANSDDCGVFTITSARQIMLGFSPLSYGPEDILVQRKRIVAELVKGELMKGEGR